jgi:hypothetical protein
MTAPTTNLWIAIPAAIGAAISFGFTGALQHTAANRVKRRAALRPALFADLAKQPIWLISLLANVSGSGLQLLALSTGPLVLVQPLLVSGLLFAVTIRSLMANRLPPGHFVFGATLCGAGLAVFLLLAKPTGGVETLTIGRAIPLAAALFAALAICLGLAWWNHGTVRALTLAAGAGVLYGVTAGVAKLALGAFHLGGPHMLVTTWPLYALIVIGPAGFLLNQNAYQADKTMAPALAVIAVTDPLVGISVGVLWLDEQLQPGPGPVVGQVTALVALIVGVRLLAHAAPQVVGAQAKQPVNEVAP